MTNYRKFDTPKMKKGPNKRLAISGTRAISAPRLTEEPTNRAERRALAKNRRLKKTS